MPAKKGSLDKSFGRRALDVSKYIGNNLWKVLPVGSAINYQNRLKSTGKNIYYDTPKDVVNKAFHGLYAIAGIFTLAIYGSLGAITGAWTPKQMKAYNEKVKIEAQMESEHKKEVEYRYDKIFENSNAKTIEDSVEIYKKYGLPIKLLNPTLEQKEKAIKQNELERSVK
jgi:hypothetical protein